MGKNVSDDSKSNINSRAVSYNSTTSNSIPDQDWLFFIEVFSLVLREVTSNFDLPITEAFQIFLINGLDDDEKLEFIRAHLSIS